MKNFKSIFKTIIDDSVYIETFSLKKKDFVDIDVMPPQSGKGFLIYCSNEKLHNVLVLLDDSEELAKKSHDSTVTIVKKALSKKT